MKPITTSVYRFSNVVKTAAGLFILAFKLNGTADETMAQIQARGIDDAILDAVLGLERRKGGR